MQRKISTKMHSTDFNIHTAGDNVKKQEETETLEASFLVTINDCVRTPQRASRIFDKRLQCDQVGLVFVVSCTFSFMACSLRGFSAVIFMQSRMN